jgi:hypothetical protein
MIAKGGTLRFPYKKNTEKLVGSRLYGMQEVIGSSPLSSIRFANRE